MNEQAHWLARGHSYSEGEVPLYRLAEEIAESLTTARPATWRKDGSNNALRAEIAKAMQAIGCGDIVKGLLENFRELMRQSRIQPLHPFGGLPAASPEHLELEYFVTEAEAELIRAEFKPRGSGRKSANREQGKGPRASETVPERNLRWYETVQLEEERVGVARGALTRAATRIVQLEGISFATAKKGLQKGKALHLENQRGGLAKKAAHQKGVMPHQLWTNTRVKSRP